MIEYRVTLLFVFLFFLVLVSFPVKYYIVTSSDPPPDSSKKTVVKRTGNDSVMSR